MLRTVKGGSAADLDSRALTTDDDLIDLDELYPSSDNPSRSAEDTSETERPPGLDGRTEIQPPGYETPTSHTTACEAAKRKEANGAAAEDARRTPLVATTLTEPKSTQAASSRPTTTPRLLPTEPTRKTARRVTQRPSLTRTIVRRLPGPGRALGVATLALVVAGVAATAIAELLTGSPAGHHPPNAASPVANAPRLALSTTQTNMSDARSLVDEKRAMSLSLERLASRRQAAERRWAQARAARQHARARTHHARPAAHTVYAAAASSSAASSTSSVNSAVSSPETSSVQRPPPAAPAPTTTTAPSSSSSSSGATKQSSASSKQPAFGSSGTLGPGSSPDG